MLKYLVPLFALAITTTFVMTATSQPPPDDKRDDRRDERRDDKRDDRRDDKRDERRPPRYELGKVLPPFVYDEIDLTKEQQKQIQDLEKEVKDKLTKILTEKQIKKVESMKPPRPPGPPRGDRRGPDEDDDRRGPPRRGGDDERGPPRKGYIDEDRNQPPPRDRDRN